MLQVFFKVSKKANSRPLPYFTFYEHCKFKCFLKTTPHVDLFFFKIFLQDVNHPKTIPYPSHFLFFHYSVRQMHFSHVSEMEEKRNENAQTKQALTEKSHGHNCNERGEFTSSKSSLSLFC